MTNSLGAYGTWAAGLAGDEPGRLSLRRGAWNDLDAWRVAGRGRVTDLLAGPRVDTASVVEVRARRVVDGVEIEELAWQLPWGPITQAVLL